MPEKFEFKLKSHHAISIPTFLALTVFMPISKFKLLVPHMVIKKFLITFLLVCFRIHYVIN